VGWATWTFCGALTGLVVGASLWQDGRVAAVPVREHSSVVAQPPAAAGITIQPSTVWVALSHKVYYHPDQPGFGREFPGVFMEEMQAIARGYWPADTPH
jgi:hypothetical protein